MRISVKRRTYKQMQKAFAYRTPKLVAECVRTWYTLGSSRSVTYYTLCPTCDYWLDREYVKFCEVCGQALKWRDELITVKENLCPEALYDEWPYFYKLEDEAPAPKHLVPPTPKKPIQLCGGYDGSVRSLKVAERSDGGSSGIRSAGAE